MPVDFTIAIAPAGGPGNSNYVVTVTNNDAAAVTVNLSCASGNGNLFDLALEVPAGAGSTAQTTCRVGNVVQAGTQLTIDGTAGGFQHSASVDLQEGNFTVEINPNGGPGNLNYTVTVRSQNYFEGVVDLQCTSNNGVLFDNSLFIPANGSAQTTCRVGNVLQPEQLVIEASHGGGALGDDDSVYLTPGNIDVTLSPQFGTQRFNFNVKVKSLGNFIGLVSLDCTTNNGNLADNEVWVTPAADGMTICRSQDVASTEAMTVQGTHLSLFADDSATIYKP